MAILDSQNSLAKFTDATLRLCNRGFSHFAKLRNSRHYGRKHSNLKRSLPPLVKYGEVTLLAIIDL